VRKVYEGATEAVRYIEREGRPGLTVVNEECVTLDECPGPNQEQEGFEREAARQALRQLEVEGSRELACQRHGRQLGRYCAAVMFALNGSRLRAFPKSNVAVSAHQVRS